MLGSITTLWALGETFNIMTFGGLALAVGILVDEATVTIENINWHLEQGKEVETAIMDGAAQIVTPAFVSMLCVCIVFVPMFFLTGIPRFLFVPMAEAVMSAMVWSFILSRTLVPTMANYLLRKHAPHTDLHGLDGPLPPSRNPFVRFQRRFEAGFEHFRLVYRQLLSMALQHRGVFVTGFLGFIICSFALAPFLGRDFFPSVDAGQILLHVRSHVGTRVEESAQQFTEIEKTIRQIIPSEDLDTVVDNIGFPVSGINMTYNNTGTIGSQDGEIQIKLREEHRPTAQYVRTMREELPNTFPVRLSHSFRPTSLAKFSILARRRPSTSKFAVLTPKRILPMRKPYSADYGTFRAWSMSASSSPLAALLSMSTSTGRELNMPASPNATSPTAWWSILPAAARSRRPTG